MSGTDADVQADSETRTDILLEVAAKAGCTDQCKLLAGYSIREIVDVVWHGTPTLRAEVRLEDMKSGTPKLVDWVKALHEIEERFCA